MAKIVLMMMMATMVVQSAVAGSASNDREVVLEQVIFTLWIVCMVIFAKFFLEVCDRNDYVLKLLVLEVKKTRSKESLYIKNE